MKKLILIAATLIALVAIIGSIGAYDNGNISLIRCLLQVAISVSVECFALKNMEE